MSPKDWTGIAALALSIVFCLVIEWLRRTRLAPYWRRRCTGKRWKRRFPGASGEEIRRYLQIFVEGFGFRRSRRLQFDPDDKLMDIYRALYPPALQGLPDTCELEQLEVSLEMEYGFTFDEKQPQDLTLGQLFEYCVRNSRRKSA